MNRLFRYKFPTTKRWYIRHKLIEHLNVCGFIGYVALWAMGLAWVYLLLN